MPRPDDSHARWPADRFYWAVLDGSVLGGAPVRGQRRRQRLGYLFESVLPGIPIESVHAVYERLPGDGERYLACGTTQSELARGVSPGTVTLAPSSVPAFVAEDVDAGGLNLLVGPFAPRPVRRLRRRQVMVALAGVVLCGASVTVGLERRVSALRREAADVAAAEQQVYELVLGPAAQASIGTSFPPERRLVAELRRLEETRSDVAPVQETADCTLALAGLLALWPGDVAVRAESVAVEPAAITIQGQVTAMSDAQRLADALEPLAGWTIGQPQSEVTRDVVELTLRLTREPRAPAGGPP
jgi:hypothetical protein